jgi:molybdenum cofactor synthesis domain-containing protein
MTTDTLSAPDTGPTAAMITVGDEILSGRTQDANMPHLAQALGAKGVPLREARVVPDVAEEIIAAVNALRTKYTHVFTSGGIGPTHDDITADSVAAAFGVGIDVREDARAILATNYKNPDGDLNDARLRMARIPDGATLIANSVSKAPGFSLGNVHVMAGVPSVFRAMVADLLPRLADGKPVLSDQIRIDLGEGRIAGPLRLVAEAHPSVSIGSYPFQENGAYGAMIVARGTDAAALAAAMAALRAMAARLV